MEAQSEKQKEAAAGIPLRIYPALDGSEADVVDRVPFHWHTESEIVIVDAGTVSLVIADRAYQGMRGDIFFIGSEELHEIRATGQGNQFHSFLFSLELLEFARADDAETSLLEPLAEGHLRFPRQVRKGEAGQEALHRLLARLVCACLRQSLGWRLTAKAALLEIVAVCADYSLIEKVDAPCGTDERLRQKKAIVAYLDEHFTEPVRLPDVAAAFGLSPQYFSTLFRESFGRTLMQHVNFLRTERAARLLRTSSLPVMEIGLRVGYENFSYFIKRFREAYGVPPSVYRKNNREFAATPVGRAH